MSDSVGGKGALRAPDSPRRWKGSSESTFLIRTDRASWQLREEDLVFQRLFMVRLLITGLSLLVIKSSLGHSGDQTPDLSSLSDADLKTVTIQLERTGCYGTCPGYSVTIHGDGRVEYNGKSHVKEIGTQEG